MKTLILTAFLTLTMNAFADQTNDINCAALSDSTDRVSVETPAVNANDESVDVTTSAR
jgi:hypothetical protein